MRMASIAAVLGLLASPGAWGQQVVRVLPGAGQGEQFGFSLDLIGDVNGDGQPDIVVGSRGLEDLGAARVYSAADGVLLRAWTGDLRDERLGNSVSGVGDVNGDGADDILVGSPATGGLGHGRAFLFSGRNGEVLYEFLAPEPLIGFGYAIDGAGDVDDDGRPDVIVGAWGDGALGPNTGAAWVYSGLTGDVLLSLTGEAANEYFGWSVATAGDVDDGHDDVIVGAQGANDLMGAARVFSGADGTVIYDWSGDGSMDNFGFRVAAAGDVDDDGTPDLLVSAYQDFGVSTYAGGYARVFSGDTGEMLHHFARPLGLYGYADEFGYGDGLAGIGDVDLDGHDDVAVGGSNGITPLDVYSGADGTLLYSSRGWWYDADDVPPIGSYGFGETVAGLGDVDGDGRPDILVGDPLVPDAEGSSTVGQVFILSFAPKAPELTGISATVGNLVGGTQVILDVEVTSTLEDLELTVGGQPAEIDKAYMNAIRILTPGVPEPDGVPVDVTVASPLGSSTLSDAFTYTPVLSATLNGDLGGGELTLGLIEDPPPEWTVPYKVADVWLGHPLEPPIDLTIVKYSGVLHEIPLLFLTQGAVTADFPLSFSYGAIDPALSGLTIRLQSRVTAEGDSFGSFSTVAEFEIP